MSTAEVPYRKLPGRSATLRFGVTSAPASTLWLGPDHLLLVIQTPSREEYRRFDYRDIQELFIEQTNRRTTVNIILGVILAVPLVIAGFNQFGPVSLAFLAWVGVPVLILFLINMLRGPTCRGYLLTAVGVEELGSLSRLRPARRAVEQIAAEVEKVQGALDSATLAAHWQKV